MTAIACNRPNHGRVTFIEYCGTSSVPGCTAKCVSVRVIFNPRCGCPPHLAERVFLAEELSPFAAVMIAVNALMQHYLGLFFCLSSVDSGDVFGPGFTLMSSAEKLAPVQEFCAFQRRGAASSREREELGPAQYITDVTTGYRQHILSRPAQLP